MNLYLKQLDRESWSRARTQLEPWEMIQSPTIQCHYGDHTGTSRWLGTFCIVTQKLKVTHWYLLRCSTWTWMSVLQILNRILWGNEAMKELLATIICIHSVDAPTTTFHYSVEAMIFRCVMTQMKMHWVTPSAWLGVPKALKLFSMDSHPCRPVLYHRDFMPVVWPCIHPNLSPPCSVWLQCPFRKRRVDTGGHGTSLICTKYCCSCKIWSWSWLTGQRASTLLRIMGIKKMCKKKRSIHFQEQAVCNSSFYQISPYFAKTTTCPRELPYSSVSPCTEFSTMRLVFNSSPISPHEFSECRKLGHNYQAFICPVLCTIQEWVPIKWINPLLLIRKRRNYNSSQWLSATPGHGKFPRNVLSYIHQVPPSVSLLHCLVCEVKCSMNWLWVWTCKHEAAGISYAHNLSTLSSGNLLLPLL